MNTEPIIPAAAATYALTGDCFRLRKQTLAPANQGQTTMAGITFLLALLLGARRSCQAGGRPDLDRDALGQRRLLDLADVLPSPRISRLCRRRAADRRDRGEAGKHRELGARRICSKVRSFETPAKCGLLRMRARRFPYPSSISSVTSCVRLTPPRVRTILAGSFSLPLRRPLATASRTAFSSRVAR